MKHIQNFLINKKEFPVLEKKELCSKILLKHTQLFFINNEISFSGKNIIIKTSFEKKHMVLLNKKDILEEIKKQKILNFYTDII